jgi:hypothetical protein
MNIQDPSSIVGSRIEKVGASVVGTHPDTGHKSFRLSIELSSGLIVDLLPDDLALAVDCPNGIQASALQVIDGRPTIAGERIVAVVTQDLRGPAAFMATAHGNLPQQLALLLSSGRLAMNVYRCGGGNVLHLESAPGIVTHFGEDWHDAWTGDDVSVEELASIPN